jgi:hypothetical protein
MRPSLVRSMSRSRLLWIVGTFVLVGAFVTIMAVRRTDGTISDSERAALLDQLREHRPEPPDVRPFVPPDQRGPWIEAWNRLRDCALRHGYDGVSPVAPTFGDGNTSAPVVRRSDGDERVFAECRFDTSRLHSDGIVPNGGGSKSFPSTVAVP